MGTLKFGQIIDLAKLDRWTAEYVLKHAAELKNMPEAGSQGKHRHFTLWQAVRFAVHTHLVMCGVPLRWAVTVVNWSEKRIAKLSRPQQRRPITYVPSGANQGWILEVVDARFARIWSQGLQLVAIRETDPPGRRGRKNAEALMDEHAIFLDTETGNEVRNPDDAACPLTDLKLDCTMLERRLAAAAG